MLAAPMIPMNLQYPLVHTELLIFVVLISSFSNIAVMRLDIRCLGYV